MEWTTQAEAIDLYRHEVWAPLVEIVRPEGKPLSLDLRRTLSAIAW